jgi:hypothetical protein
VKYDVSSCVGAPDVWESVAFSGIFLATGFSCYQAESTPAHTQVTQTVSPLWEICGKFFQANGFSTVSLGAFSIFVK